MRFFETGFRDLWVIEIDPFADERGTFARTFCANEFHEQGLENRFVQHSRSYSARAGTLRGMHFQKEPFAETKLVSCLNGAIWDVVLDLRLGSPTYLEWFGLELAALGTKQLYIPKGFAHGFQTLTDDTVVSYAISEFYNPQAATGVRYDDPAFGLKWQLVPTVISQRDSMWPLFVHEESR